MEQKRNTKHVRFAMARYHLEIFMLSRGQIGARIACKLSIFWLRFLYRLGVVKKFELCIDQHHPLVDDKDCNLMVVDGVDGEYVRLVDHMRNYLNTQHERFYDGPIFPKARWFDKVFAFFGVFFPSRVESAWDTNIYSDVH